MKKYLYTLLALLMVNLNAEVLSGVPIRALSDEFNTDREKVSRMLLKKHEPYMDAFFCPYVGLALVGTNAGVAYRNENSTMEIDVRYNVTFFFTSGTISVSRIIMLGDRNKRDPMGYIGLGSGIGLYDSAFMRGDEFRVLFTPRIFYGVEHLGGFTDFGVSLMIDPIQRLVAAPLPDLRWGIRF